jgi:hypothetical protein
MSGVLNKASCKCNFSKVLGSDSVYDYYEKMTPLIATNLSNSDMLLSCLANWAKKVLLNMKKTFVIHFKRNKLLFCL